MRWTKALLLSAATVDALDGPGWRSQSIYQVVTDRFARTDGSLTATCDLGNYCGGSFQGLIKKLDYIQGMGFTAIWISPVIANLNTSTPYGRPYHGYWPQNNYAINPKFGTAADLVSLSKALHDRGMFLMVDVVPNHMAFNGAPADIRWTDFVPFNDQKYFHMPYCAVDYANASSVTDCWVGDRTVSLPDIKSDDPTVQSMWNDWVKGLVANYSIDGLRVDSAQQINKDFFPTFVSSGGVYQVGEVLNGGPDYLCDYQKYLTSVLNYAYYFWIKDSFSAGGSLKTLSNNIGWLKSTCSDVTTMPIFMENHDQPRWPSFVDDSSLIANALSFTIMSDGIPLVYYGQEQGFTGATDPDNREPMWPSKYDTTTDLYRFISNLNTFRNFAIGKDPSYASTTGKSLYSDASALVRMKGSSGNRVVSIWTNDGSSGADRTVSLATSLTGFGSNAGFTDVVSCTVYTTDSSGTLNVTISRGMPLVLYRADGLPGSGVCSATKTASTPATAAASVVPNRAVSGAVASSTVVSNSASDAKSTSSVLSAPPATSTSTSLASATSTARTSSTLTSVSTPTGVKSTSSTAASTSTSVARTMSTSSTLSILPTTSLEAKTSSSLVPAATSSLTSSPVAMSTSSSIISATSYSSSSQKATSISAAASQTTACVPPTSVPVRFQVNATTVWGQSVYLTGSSDALNSWDTSVALTMSAQDYPIWAVNVTMDVGQYFEYKFFKAAGGTPSWEADPNRNFTVLTATACVVGAPVATIGGDWQSPSSAAATPSVVNSAAAVTSSSMSSPSKQAVSVAEVPPSSSWTESRQTTSAPIPSSADPKTSAQMTATSSFAAPGVQTTPSPSPSSPMQTSPSSSPSVTSTQTSTAPISQSAPTNPVQSAYPSQQSSSSTLAVTTDNQCGAAVGSTCAGSTLPRGGQCCSRYNSCGATADYCCPQRRSTGGGCQPGFGNCLDANDPICTGGPSTASSSPSSSTTTIQSGTTAAAPASPSSGSSSITPSGTAAAQANMLPITTTNQCGPAANLTCLGSRDPRGGQCCSRYNSCGSTADYCCPQRRSTGGGCQAGFGMCLDAADAMCTGTGTAARKRARGVWRW